LIQILVIEVTECLFSELVIQLGITFFYIQ